MKMNLLISLLVFGFGKLATAQGLPSVQRLECSLQVFYPKDGCGNCSTVSRNFMLQGSQNKQEIIDLSSFKPDGRAINKVISYQVTLESAKMIHFAVKIHDKANNTRSQSAIPYLPATRGMFVNLSDESGINLSLFCNPKL